MGNSAVILRYQMLFVVIVVVAVVAAVLDVTVGVVTDSIYYFKERLLVPECPSGPPRTTSSS